MASNPIAYSDIPEGATVINEPQQYSDVPAGANIVEQPASQSMPDRFGGGISGYEGRRTGGVEPRGVSAGVEMAQEPGGATAEFEPAALGGVPQAVWTEATRIAQDPKAQRLALEMAGMTAGAMALGVAAPASAPIATIASIITKYPRIAQTLKTMVGAGAGGAAGSIVAETVDPTEQPARTAGIAGATGVVGEGLGTGMVAIGGKMFAPLKNKLEEGAEWAIKALEKRGALLTPGQASRSKLIDVPEGISEAPIIGGVKLMRKKKEAKAVADQMAKEYAESISAKMDIADSDALIQSYIAGVSEHSKVQGGALFKKVDEAYDTATVGMESVKDLADKMLSEARGLKSPEAKKLLNEIIEQADSMSFSDAQALRSDLVNIGRLSEREVVAGKTQAIGKRLAGAVDKAMEKTAGDLGPEATALWREANAFWKNYRSSFNDTVVKRVMHGNTDGVFNYIMKSGKPDAIAKIKSLILKDVGELTNGKEVWTKIQGQWAHEAIDKATKGGQVSGEVLMNNISPSRTFSLSTLMLSP